MSGKLPYYLAGAFFILSPLSVAGQYEAADTAKYLRLATTACLVLCGLSNGSLSRMKRASLASLPFLVIWCVSPIWSSSPAWGLFHKGMFGLTYLSGLVLGLTPRTIGALQAGLRILGGVSLTAAVVVLIEYVRNPELSTMHGRMAVGGVNANMLAYTAVPCAILCAYLALYGRRRVSRHVAAGGFALLLMILLLSGSRGGIVTAVMGCGILAIPIARRPGALLLALGVVFGAGFIAIELLNVGEQARAVTELTKDTRSKIWSRAFDIFLSNPLIGVGWFSQPGGSRWATVQSSYLQVLVETGILGGAVFAVAMVGAALRLLATRRESRASAEMNRLWYLANACICASLFNGVFETSIVIGTSLIPLLLGFGVGLVDRIPALAQTDGGRAAGRVQWRWYVVPSAPAPASSAVATGAPGGTGT